MTPKRISFKSSLGGDQVISILDQANAGTKRPVLIELMGAGEVNNYNFAGGSVCDQLSRDLKLPASYADVIVVCAHKPSDGNGLFQYERAKDTKNWIIANLGSMIDPNRIALGGLSLGGGAVMQATQDLEFAKSLCAIVPCAAMPDIDIKAKLFPALKAAALPALIYGSTADSNGLANSCFYQVLFAYNGLSAADRALYPLPFDTHRDHGTTWGTSDDFSGSNSMFDWLSKQTRTGIVAGGGTTTITENLISSQKVPGQVIPGREAIVIPAVGAITIPDKTVNVYLRSDGTYRTEIV